MDSTQIFESGQGLALAPSSTTWSIQRIEHAPGDAKPLRVHLRANSKDYSLPCRAIDLQSFTAFQRLSADVLGIWLDGWEFSGRSGREAWQETIETAFSEGRRQ